MDQVWSSGADALVVACTPSGGGHLALRLAGELDAFEARATEKRLRLLLDEHRPSVLILDLDTLEFLDVAGARVLVAVAADVQSAGGTCRVTGARPLHRRLLDLVADGVRPVALSFVPP
jgi:anti-anti-sigma factor